MTLSKAGIYIHGEGAYWLVPTVRTIIDVGRQGAKAIRLDETRYVYNDKWASRNLFKPAYRFFYSLFQFRVPPAIKSGL